MMLNKEKLINKIHQDIANAEEAIGLVLKSRNFHVAGDLKHVVDYLRCLEWEIQNGNFDYKDFIIGEKTKEV